MMENEMTLMRKPIATIQVILLCLLLALCFSCESKDKYAGTYEAKDRPGEVRLELKANGEGLWISGTQEVSFSWYLKSGELRINTKEGGVIVGQIKGDTIKVNIPGKKEMVFQRAR
jgi:hypothetical protein